MATQARRRGTAQAGDRRHSTNWSRRLAAQSRARVARAGRSRIADFQDFFRSVTPIDVIERMQIGSRSIWEVGSTDAGARRVRSTPWVFAWSQSRYFLPGWYGAGVALHAAIAAGELERAARHAMAAGGSSPR